MQSTQCTRTTRVGVHKRALGGKAIDGAKLSISAWPRRDQTPNGHWCKRLNISPTNFPYEQPLLQAFASNFPWRLLAAATGAGAAPWARATNFVKKLPFIVNVTYLEINGFNASMWVSYSPSDPKKSQCIERCVQIHQICVNKHRCYNHINFEVSLHF